MRTWEGRVLHLFVLLLILGNLAAQSMLARKAFDNEPVNAYSPSATDSRDYVGRAETLVGPGGFQEAFEDGQRMPGYPIFLAAFLGFARPRLMARYAQILLSPLVILFAYLTLRNIVRSRLPCAVGAAMVAAWFPLYYFSPILIAESVSVMAFSLLLYLLSRAGRRGGGHLYLSAVPLCFLLLVYLKPNHVFVAPAILAFPLIQMSRRSLPYLAGFAAVSLCGILPWSVFVSVAQHQVIPLSTTAGVNLYLGTGAEGSQERGEVESAPSASADAPGAADPRRAAERDRAYLRAAQDVWQARPFRTAMFGVRKALHTLGFALRDVRDLALVGLFLTSVAASLLLWIRRAHREWCLVYCLLLGAVLAQAFVFLANQRFRVVIFDLAAVMLIALGVAVLWERRSGGLRTTEGRTAAS